jgi:hypothetical protein
MTRSAIILLLLFLSPAAEAQSLTCKSRTLEYSAGATICECPSLTGDGRLAAGSQAQISSQRLMCGPTGEWKSTGTLCLDVQSSGGIAAEDYAKFYNLYCPRTAVATSDELDARTGQILATLTPMCRPLGRWAGGCRAFLFGIAFALQ